MKYFTLFHDEYLKIKEFQDLIVLGDKIEECLTDKNDLVKNMKEYYVLKESK